MTDEQWSTWHETKTKRPVDPQRAAAARRANQQEDLAVPPIDLKSPTPDAQTSR